MNFPICLSQFKVIIDYRPRPHYIILGRKNLYGTFPSTKYKNQFISDVKNALITLKEKSIIFSIHLGYYRRSNDFHAHLIVPPSNTFIENWGNNFAENRECKNKLDGLNILHNWSKITRKNYLKYKAYDLDDLKNKPSFSISKDQRTFLKTINLYFDEYRPLIHLRESKNFSKIYDDLVRISKILKLNQKPRGGHICIKYDDNKYQGWVLVDIRTFYAVHPNKNQWLNNFIDDQQYYVST